jgi:hypothetical protein
MAEEVAVAAEKKAEKEGAKLHWLIAKEKWYKAVETAMAAKFKQFKSGELAGMNEIMSYWALGMSETANAKCTKAGEEINALDVKKTNWTKAINTWDQMIIKIKNVNSHENDEIENLKTLKLSDANAKKKEAQTELKYIA